MYFRDQSGLFEVRDEDAGKADADQCNNYTGNQIGRVMRVTQLALAPSDSGISRLLRLSLTRNGLSLSAGAVRCTRSALRLSAAAICHQRDRSPLP
jgi:hypothetical protein